MRHTLVKFNVAASTSGEAVNEYRNRQFVLVGFWRSLFGWLPLPRVGLICAMQPRLASRWAAAKARRGSIEIGASQFSGFRWSISALRGALCVIYSGLLAAAGQPRGQHIMKGIQSAAPRLIYDLASGSDGGGKALCWMKKGRASAERARPHISNKSGPRWG